jgi:hypothetical protein
VERLVGELAKEKYRVKRLVRADVAFRKQINLLEGKLAWHEQNYVVSGTSRPGCIHNPIVVD